MIAGNCCAGRTRSQRLRITLDIGVGFDINFILSRCGKSTPVEALPHSGNNPYENRYADQSANDAPGNDAVCLSVVGVRAMGFII